MGKKLGFLEVGTSDFHTLLEFYDDSVTGISMEPLKFYLDNLPNRPLVKKLAAALVAEPTPYVDVYYMKPEVIYDPKNDINDFMKGCNSVGKPHDYHTHYNKYSTGYVDENTKIRNLIEEGLVEITQAPAYTYEQLMNIYDIDYFDTVKLDTEGTDAPLLQSILDYHEKSGKLLPKYLEFETNKHNDQNEVNKVAQRLISLGYSLEIGDAWYDEWVEFSGEFKNDCRAVLNR